MALTEAQYERMMMFYDTYQSHAAAALSPYWKEHGYAPGEQIAADHFRAQAIGEGLPDLKTWKPEPLAGDVVLEF